MTSPGHNSGQPTWASFIDGLVAEHGSLVQVSERLAATHSWREDVESISRALRRLRNRGSLSGGKWGDRLLRTFGLPASIDSRLRFMGSYHSRFVDLPVPLCMDLVQLWDRPPTSESHSGRLWLSLARVTLALRQGQYEDASIHLQTSKKLSAGVPVAQAEIALGLSLLETRCRPTMVSSSLDEVPSYLVQISGDDADCLRARYVGQVSHALNAAGKIAEAEALHFALPDLSTTHSFARSRRANGIAYGRYRHRDLQSALNYANLAARHAGDAGHVRLRAMALLMVSRVATDRDECSDALNRARAIAKALQDTILLSRCEVAEQGRA